MTDLIEGFLIVTLLAMGLCACVAFWGVLVYGIRSVLSFL